MYTQDFIRRCKLEYPDWPNLHKLLDEGSVFVGRYLDDGGQETINPSDVLDDSKLPALKERAARIARRRKLYHEWCLVTKEGAMCKKYVTDILKGQSISTIEVKESNLGISNIFNCITIVLDSGRRFEITGVFDYTNHDGSVCVDEVTDWNALGNEWHDAKKENPPAPNMYYTRYVGSDLFNLYLGEKRGAHVWNGSEWVTDDQDVVWWCNCGE